MKVLVISDIHGSGYYAEKRSQIKNENICQRLFEKQFCKMKCTFCGSFFVTVHG